jgi:hypothetical protein
MQLGTADKSVRIYIIGFKAKRNFVCLQVKNLKQNNILRFHMSSSLLLYLNSHILYKQHFDWSYVCTVQIARPTAYLSENHSFLAHMTKD